MPKLVREGEEGQYKAKGPAPLTRHRDKSDLFILVKKSNKDNFALHLARPIKSEFSLSLCMVSFFLLRRLLQRKGYRSISALPGKRLSSLPGSGGPPAS